MQIGFEIFLQVLIPALKITSQERMSLEDDAAEFVNLSLDICQDCESQSIKTNAALLLIALDKNVDGMQTFIVDFSLNLLDKIVQKSN